MKLKIKAAVLLCLAAAAVITGAKAYRTLKPAEKGVLPEEIYARFAAGEDSASFFIKSSGDYVAVYEDKRGKKPVAVTTIELECLRNADKAMVEAGIPVKDRRELLTLLEDLGS